MVVIQTCHFGKAENLKSTPIGNDPLPGMEQVFTHISGGENMFMPDPKIDAVKPGPVGLNCVAGLLNTYQHLLVLGSPTVNSIPTTYGILDFGHLYMLIGDIKIELAVFVFQRQDVLNIVQLIQLIIHIY